MAEDERADAREEDDPKQVEFQLGGRHLTMAVAGLALFGVVLFLLGRWSERVARPEAQAAEGIEESSLPSTRSEPDPAAPRELTFYETLGKKAAPGFQESSRKTARKEPPVVLPESAPLPAAPAEKASPAPEAKPKEPSRAATAPAGGERFRVQVASTRDMAAARQLVDRLRRKGYAASLDTIRGADGKSQYKVRVGSYSERAPAEDLANRIRSEEKVGAWIVKVQG